LLRRTITLSNKANGMSNIEGKATRVGARNEQGDTCDIDG